MPLGDKRYLYLAADNIGAVIMPWMVFYQQSAVADKKLRPEHYRYAHWNTALGAVVTQAVMVAILVAAAATIGKVNTNANLNTIGDIALATTARSGLDLWCKLLSRPARGPEGRLSVLPDQ
jgi:Mn2+/Fe2+ NRAMP family transporter